jgi:hypothetical protein
MNVRTWIVSIAAVPVIGMLAAAGTAPRAQDGSRVERITWDDLAPVHALLEARGLAAASFAAYVERVHGDNIRRVHEGDLDHLVFYLLQSTRFTTLPPIEPALSAKTFATSQGASDTEVLSDAWDASAARIPAAVEERIAALVRAADSPSSDSRLRFFGDLTTSMFADRRERHAALVREYVRVMRFVYEKEFVAQRSGPAAVADLYRRRGLSTDTAVEAGYLVHLGLGVAHALDPDRRVTRALIVGPGLDLAPRTALDEDGPPESYQPWAVMDALFALGLARAGELELVAADINPRVVAHLQRASAAPPALRLVSEIRESESVTLTSEYREYFARLGTAIGQPAATPADSAKGRLAKVVRVEASSARSLRIASLDVVAERLAGPPFDLVVATNILPYFPDAELMLALANISRMLAPGGIFLHNEARPLMREVTAALGVPLLQSRHATIATVRGAPAPLFDSVWVHRKR